MITLYKVAGISKQAVSQQAKRDSCFQAQALELIQEADHLREEHPGCGVEKMYFTLKPDLLGRDRFVDLFMDLGYRVRRTKNYHRTTFPGHISYPNLIKGMQIDGPSTIWQSDITYIRVGQRFYYAVFIIDVYSKIIVGYDVSDNMRAEANMRALRMALKKFKPPEIHHSDRGKQYIYNKYIEMLNKNQCEISMSKTAQDNAYAERINLTIKDEYLKHWEIKSYNQLKSAVQKAVYNYNNKRNHDSLGRITPMGFFKQWQTISVEERKTITIFDNGTN